MSDAAREIIEGLASADVSRVRKKKEKFEGFERHGCSLYNRVWGEGRKVIIQVSADLNDKK